jgi:hypothetical protein
MFPRQPFPLFELSIHTESIPNSLSHTLPALARHTPASPFPVCVMGSSMSNLLPDELEELEAETGCKKQRDDPSSAFVLINPPPPPPLLSSSCCAVSQAELSRLFERFRSLDKSGKVRRVCARVLCRPSHCLRRHRVFFPAATCSAFLRFAAPKFITGLRFAALFLRLCAFARSAMRRPTLTCS